MGYCGRLNGERESGLCQSKQEGMKKEYRSCKIVVNTALLSVNLQNKEYAIGYAAFVFLLLTVLLCSLQFFRTDTLFSFPLALANTAHSPSLRLPSCNNPRPIFSNCTRNEATTVCSRQSQFRKKHHVYYCLN